MCVNKTPELQSSDLIEQEFADLITISPRLQFCFQSRHPCFTVIHLQNRSQDMHDPVKLYPPFHPSSSLPTFLNWFLSLTQPSTIIHTNNMLNTKKILWPWLLLGKVVVAIKISRSRQISSTSSLRSFHGIVNMISKSSFKSKLSVLFSDIIREILLTNITRCWYNHSSDIRWLSSYLQFCGPNSSNACYPATTVGGISCVDFLLSCLHVKQCLWTRLPLIN